MDTRNELPDRERILRRMWALANAGAGDAVKLACFEADQWCAPDRLELDALTEFKRSSSGVVELKFIDRAKLLERLLDAVDSGQDQMERFLQDVEEQEGEQWQG